MKLVISFILLCLSFASLNAQLFEAITSKDNLRAKRTNIPERRTTRLQNSHPSVPGTANSLFQTFVQKNEHKVAETVASKKANTSGSLFSNAFSRKTNNANSNKSTTKSLFGETRPVVESTPISIPKPAVHHSAKPSIQKRHAERLDRDDIEDEIHMFIEKSRKISTKIKNNEKTLSSLNSRIEELVNKNNNIKLQIKKYKSLKRDKRHLEDKVTNFIEKYEGEVKNIENNIVKKTETVEQQLKQKSSSLDKTYKDVVSNYSNLQTEVDVVKEKLDEIKKLEDENFNKLRKRLVLDDVKVKNKLDVNGVAFINKINTDSVNLGSIRIDSNKLMFSNEGSKIMVGDEIITVKDFFAIVKTMKGLQKKCGENLEKCKPIDADYLKEQEKKEIDILENLKNLRKATSEFLLNKREN